MTRRRTTKQTRTRRWRLLFAGGAVAATLGIGQLVYAADGSDVAAKLGQATSVVGLLSSAISADGDYGDEANANAVPFLGGEPGSLIADLFEELDPLGGFANFNPGDEDPASVVSDKVSAVDGALGGGKLLDAVFTCGSAACQLDDTKPDPSKVKDITEISFRLAIGGSDEDTIPFTSLGLPSIGFLPDDGDLKVNLSWSVDVRIVADADGLRLAPAPGDTKELTLGATISLETDTFSVDLGALVVEAKTETDPRFSGQLQVDLNDDGSFSFGFGDNAGFSAAWKLETKDSPLPGVRGTLAINWPLEGDGVNPSELSIEVKDIAINAKQFVGEGMQDAAAAIRTITRPLRTATSPMMEPIPGLSDLSDAIGGGEVTMLKLMEQAKGASLSNPFPATDVSTFLTRLQRLDDVVAALEGDDNWVPLGSVKVVGDEALKPVGLAFDPAKLQGQLDNLIDKCGIECKERIDDLLTAVNGGATPGQGGFKFDLPVLSDPATLAGLLLGRDVDLVTFETGRLGYPRDNLNIPLARFLMFSVELDGAIEATFNVKGGVDTRGIIDALRAGASAEVVNGVYLQRPSDGGPIVRLMSEAELDFAAGFFGVGVELGGGPKPDIALTVPASSPGGKLRPALDGSGDRLQAARGGRRQGQIRRQRDRDVRLPPRLGDGGARVAHVPHRAGPVRARRERRRTRPRRRQAPGHQPGGHACGAGGRARFGHGVHAP